MLRPPPHLRRSRPPHPWRHERPGEHQARPSLNEPLRVAKDNGAKRCLIPIENKRNFLDVAADVMEHVDPIFYGDHGDPKTAAQKVIG